MTDAALDGAADHEALLVRRRARLDQVDRLISVVRDVLNRAAERPATEFQAAHDLVKRKVVQTIQVAHRVELSRARPEGRAVRCHGGSRIAVAPQWGQRRWEEAWGKRPGESALGSRRAPKTITSFRGMS